MDLEIEIASHYRFRFQPPQQKWVGKSPDLMQKAVFAGEEMMAIQKSDDEPDQFELHFLGLVGTGFQSMEEAKQLAPAFAKEVFTYLAQMIEQH